ncbi:hypothetical protein IEQ34_006504 [Dendrobium chrysotoxum]|uniref:Cytochrome P450 n=1 Tax=Dendrobium chrysotoxum TaxID=161865 RepID=A0AAV7H7Y8_DENCH|nr:hypothetical protein IEQ34_006504 [Dendrobium chrysotoxum]
METQILSILLPSILCTILLILLFKKLPLKKTSNPSNISPGPWKLPIIGNFHQLFGEHRHHWLQNLAKVYSPLFHLKLVITSSEFIHDIFKIHDLKFASRPKQYNPLQLCYIGFAPYGKTWSKLHKICTVEFFSLKRVMSFKFIREEEGNNLVENIMIAKRSPVNLSEMLLSLLNVTIARAAFGKGSAQQKGFLLIMKKTLEYL